MSTLRWLLLAFLYSTLFVTLALTMLRNGHPISITRTWLQRLSRKLYRLSSR